MDDLTRKNAHNEPDLSTDLDGVQREAEQHSDDAQEVIQEAKEQAKREWGGAYDDTDYNPDQDQARLEGDAQNLKDDLVGDTGNASDLGQGADYTLQSEAREATDHMAGEVRHEAETLGDTATGGGDDHSVVDDIQDAAKGFIDKVKDAFDGDKKS